MVKEMYPAPAASCAGIDPTYLMPTSGAAVMVRDAAALVRRLVLGLVRVERLEPRLPAPTRRTATPTWASGSTAPTATPRPATTTPSPACATSRGCPACRWSSCSQHFFNPAPAPNHHILVGFTGDDPRRIGEPFDLPNPALPRPPAGAAPGRGGLGEGLPPAVGDLRQRLAGGRHADRGRAVRHLRPVHRLPRRRQHRPPVRHDGAQPGRRLDAAQPLPLRHLAHLADGPRRARPDLLRPARQRDPDLPPRAVAGDPEHLPGLPRHPRPAPVRHRPRQAGGPGAEHREEGGLPALPAHDRRRRALPGRQPERPARRLRRAGPRRHLVHRLPPHAGRPRRRRSRPRRAAEPLRAEPAGAAQPGDDRLRPHLHRQLPGRRAHRAERARSPTPSPSRWSRRWG